MQERRFLITAVSLGGALLVGLLAGRASVGAEEEEPVLESKSFDLDALSEAMREKSKRWETFLNVDSMFCGVYRLEEGATDSQSPHAQDEVYVVRSGKGTLIAGEERYPAKAGSTFFVRRGIPHRFVDIEEDMEVLVVFPKSPALEKD